MLWSRKMGLLLLAAAAPAQPPPSTVEQEKIIADLRVYAQDYIRKLPDFICLQITKREIRVAPNEGFSGIRETGGRGGPGRITSGDSNSKDTFEEQLTFFDRREMYQLLKINGARQKPGQPRPPGMTSTGEFGTTLNAVFDLQSNTEFEWKRWDTLRGQTVVVFSFHIDQPHSQAQLDVPSRSVVVGYHGLIFADRNTNMVLRLTTEAEAPKDFPLQDVTHVLDYGRVQISGVEFTLPLHAGMQTRMSEDFMRYGREGGHSKQVYLTNEVDFRDYRKYTAESVIKP
ncbi:MAG TPA: hypothetical protein VF146_17190 [Bryobacteraceae bacterium]